jgi:hypothetical protein
MNELSPGMRRSVPGGSGGAATAGAGRRSAARSRLTSRQVISSRPASAPAAAAAAAAPPEIRNRRLAGHGDGAASAGLGRKVKENAGCAGCVGPAGCAGSLSRSAALTSHLSAHPPAAAPASVGTA